MAIISQELCRDYQYCERGKAIWVRICHPVSVERSCGIHKVIDREGTAFYVPAPGFSNCRLTHFLPKKGGIAIGREVDGKLDVY
jgi:hypothetical protein